MVCVSGNGSGGCGFGCCILHSTWEASPKVITLKYKLMNESRLLRKSRFFYTIVSKRNMNCTAESCEGYKKEK